MKQDIVLISCVTEYSPKICEALKRSGIDVHQSESIDIAKAGLVSYSPAFLLLDIDMEGAGRFLTEISKSVLYPPPFIITTGSFSSGEDWVSLFNHGTDVCIRKPISAEKILAVINAVFRRERKIARLHIGRLLPCINYKDLSIDPLRRTVQMRKKAVELTEKEFDILHLLAFHSGNVLTREEIYELVWKRACGSSAVSVSGHIFSIRQKLGLDSKDKDYIQTVFGVGYRFARME